MQENHNLKALLAEGLQYDPHYLPSMNSDHLPMTLCAMVGLGAGETELTAFRLDYQKRLHDIVPGVPLESWREAVGRADRYPDLLVTCLREINERGEDVVLREVLQYCMESMAFEAFHALIRLGFAISFDSMEEKAAALAYWLASHRTVPVDEHKKIVLKDAMMAQHERGPMRFESGRFGGRITELLQSDSYPAGACAGLQECASLSLDVYRSTRNFFALHMVTATQAARQCLPYVEKDRLLASLSGALLSAHLVVDSPAFDARVPQPVPEQLDPEHALKYVWACLSEYRHYGDARYLEEARNFRQQGLIPDWCQLDN